MITGQDKPDAGSIRVGDTRRSSPTSTRAATRLDPDKTRLGGDHRRAGHHRAGPAQGQLAAPTSPASASAAPTSRRRWASSPAASATACTWPACSSSGGNVILLDEPTNDLDVEHHAGPGGSARELRRLRAWSSATTAGSWTASPPTSWPSRATAHVVWFEGNFSEYAENKKKRLGETADVPHRIKYRHLTRG